MGRFFRAIAIRTTVMASDTSLLFQTAWVRQYKRLFAAFRWATSRQMQARRRCSQCAERIRREALVCRYCGAEQTPMAQTTSKASVFGLGILGVAGIAAGSASLSYLEFSPTAAAKSATVIGS